MVYTFFDKNSSCSDVNNKTKENQQLAVELHKLIIKNFYKIRAHSSFKDNIWDAGLTDMQLIRKFNKGNRFLLYTIDVFSKYAWVAPLKDKNGITIVNVFQKILHNSTKYGW